MTSPTSTLAGFRWTPKIRELRCFQMFQHAAMNLNILQPTPCVTDVFPFSLFEKSQSKSAAPLSPGDRDHDHTTY